MAQNQKEGKKIRAISWFFLILCMFISVSDGSFSLAGDDFSLKSELLKIKSDYSEFYLDGNNLLLLGLGIGVNGISANTHLDKDIQNAYSNHVKSSTTDDLSTWAKQPGEGLYTIPALLGGYIFLRDTPVGDWSQRSLRALAVGGPTTLFLQYAIGSESPQDGGSGWKPFQSHNAVSGHAFVGSVPFITAAQMFDNIGLKIALYGVSILPAVSRINDSQHYFSQAFLGWYLGLLSCNTVYRTDHKDKETISIYPVPIAGNGLAVVIMKRF
ncbi:MAG TPA: phosphatase PAP2 family protein [Syntrophales bacterium]|nr:phosphatase PAP2 family protein [Syntrophales bacterium]